MKKSIISAILLLAIIATLGVFINNAKVQNKNFLVIDKSLERIGIFNKDFDIYIKHSLTYDNFDLIQKQIDSFYKEFNKIKENDILRNISNDKLKNSIHEVEIAMEKKFVAIDKVKSYRAIMNNSFRIIQRVYKYKIAVIFAKHYNIIMTLDNNIGLDIKQELKELNKIDIKSLKNSYDIYFLTHAKIMLKYKLKFLETESYLEDLKINKKLEILHSLYEQYSSKSTKKAEVSITILFILLSIAILLYLIFEYRLRKSNFELLKFKTTVENSGNTVLITDENEIVTYVNDAFLHATGYSECDIIGQKPNVIKSNKHSKEFYQELHDTIYSGKKWNGEFINKNKAGELIYEKCSIMPILDNNGKILEFISIKMDITKDVHSALELKEKEQLLIQQSKMAAMGEMLENIAHQWRQPLSVIATLSTSMLMKKELNLKISLEEELDVFNQINTTTQHLSDTIDNFRDYFRSGKEKTKFNLKILYKQTLKLINSKFKSLNIEVIANADNVFITSLENEVTQVLMNIINNARDILETKENQKRLIFIDISKNDVDAIIEIKDNAGGIPEDIIDKIFEPYFTTKHQSQGTGIGLYMSQDMVVKHMKGTIKVENDEYTYEDISYKGAKFTVTLPLKELSD